MDKKLLRSVREYKKQSFLTPVLVAAEVFVEVLIPLLMAKIIDVGIMNGDMAYIIKPVSYTHLTLPTNSLV